MQVKLNAISGIYQGRPTSVADGLVSQFGRTEFADFSFPDDEALADFHFALDCRDHRCVLHALCESPVWVNDTEVRQQILKSGDVIRAGETQWSVLIAGMSEEAIAETEQSAPIDPVAAAAMAMSVVDLCKRLELDEEAPTLAAESKDASELVAKLGAIEDFRQALRVRAFTLGRRPAIAWGCHLVQKVLGDRLIPEQAEALKAAVEWTHKPEQPQCQKAELAALRAAYAGPGGVLAAAAFWCGDNIAPAESPAKVEPALELASQGVAAALTMTLYHRPEPPITIQFQEFIDVADDIETGKLKL